MLIINLLNENIPKKASVFKDIVLSTIFFIKKRVKLINLVIEQGLGMSKAAKKMNIKLSTAKVIVANYTKRGKIFKKRC